MLRRTAALLRLPYLAQGVDEETFLRSGLALIEEHTGSTVALAYLVGDDGRTLEAGVGSEGLLQALGDSGLAEPGTLREGGAWADALSDRHAVFVDDSRSAAPAWDLPAGRPGFSRFLVVPVLEGDTVVMLVGVGNKETDYTEADAETVQLLGGAVWRTLQLQRDRLELERRERLLNHAGELAAVGGWELDAVTGAVRWTPETFRIHDLPLGSDPPLEDALRYYHPDDRPILEGALKAALERGEPYDLELRMTTAAGRSIWTRSICRPEVEDGVVVRLRGAFQDITSQKVAAGELERLAAIVAHSADVMALVDRDFRYLAVNPAYARAFGRRQADFIGRHLQEIVGEEYFTDRLRERMERCLGGEEGMGHEAWITLPGGGRRYASVRYAPHRGPDGTIVGLVINARDDTERKTAEAGLSQAFGQLDLAVATAQLGFWRYSLDAGRFEFSDQQLSHFGMKERADGQDLKTWLRLVHPEDRPVFRRGVRDLARGKEVVGAEFRIVRPDGVVRHVKVSGVPLKDESGHVQGVVGVTQDVTEMTEAQARLRRAAARQQALGRRLTRIREEERDHIARELHDVVGQALTAARMDLAGMLASIPEMSPKASERAAALDEVLDQGLAAVQRLASAIHSPVLKVLGLGAAVDELATSFAERYGTPCHVHVDDRIADADSRVSVAGYRIVQEALTNVVRHAGASRVDVSLVCEALQLVVRVDDDGVGIVIEDFDSTSLGLLGMRERAEALGGSVSVESRPEGGTRVEATLPLRAPKLPPL